MNKFAILGIGALELSLAQTTRPRNTGTAFNPRTTTAAPARQTVDPTLIDSLVQRILDDTQPLLADLLSQFPPTVDDEVLIFNLTIPQDGPPVSSAEIIVGTAPPQTLSTTPCRPSEVRQAAATPSFAVLPGDGVPLYRNSILNLGATLAADLFGSLADLTDKNAVEPWPRDEIEALLPPPRPLAPVIEYVPEAGIDYSTPEGHFLSVLNGMLLMPATLLDAKLFDHAQWITGGILRGLCHFPLECRKVIDIIEGIRGLIRGTLTPIVSTPLDYAALYADLYGVKMKSRQSDLTLIEDVLAQANRLEGRVAALREEPCDQAEVRIRFQSLSTTVAPTTTRPTTAVTRAPVRSPQNFVAPPRPRTTTPRPTTPTTLARLELMFGPPSTQPLKAEVGTPGIRSFVQTLGAVARPPVLLPETSEVSGDDTSWSA